MSEWSDRGDVSKFNPAALKMNRLNDISEIINQAKLNLSAWNSDFNDWCFNVYFNAIVNLYGEVFVKFREEEVDECEEIRKAIVKMMDEYPIRERMANGKWTTQNTARLKIICRALELYEHKVKKYQDSHGLDTPNIEDEEGL